MANEREAYARLADRIAGVLCVLVVLVSALGWLSILVHGPRLNFGTPTSKASENAWLAAMAPLVLVFSPRAADLLLSLAPLSIPGSIILGSLYAATAVGVFRRRYVPRAFIVGLSLVGLFFDARSLSEAIDNVRVASVTRGEWQQIIAISLSALAVNLLILGFLLVRPAVLRNRATVES